jgi:hypothetical protein
MCASDLHVCESLADVGSDRGVGGEERGYVILAGQNSARTLATRIWRPQSDKSLRGLRHSMHT